MEMTSEQIFELPLLHVKKERPRWKKVLYEALAYIGLFLFALISYIVFTPLYSYYRNGVIAQCYTGFIVAVLIFVLAVMKKTGHLTQERLLIFLFLIGFTIRLGYILYTPGTTRQHDTWSSNYDGHFAYADIIFSTGALPTTNEYQFYHPPLNALIQAGFMHVFEGITDFVNTYCSAIIYGGALEATHDAYYSSCQILSLMYSTIVMECAIRLFRRMKLKGRAWTISSAFVIFFPRLIQLSGQLNNDMLSIMFAIMGIYFAVRWRDEKSYFSIIMCAISIGCSMMAKLSGAIVAFPVALIFIWEFVESIVKKDYGCVGHTFIQFVIFLLICVPLGLWFQVYAYITFGQSFGYVFSNLNSSLYVGDYSFVERFLLPISGDIVNNGIFAAPFYDYNLIGYTIQSAIFGEFKYWQGEAFGLVALVSNYIFVFMTIILFIILACKKKMNLLSKDGVLAWFTVIAYWGCQIYFNISMPYGCTMDFRYIVPIIIPFGYYAGKIDDECRNMSRPFQVTGTIYRYITYTFLGSSMLFYMVCI